MFEKSEEQWLYEAARELAKERHVYCVKFAEGVRCPQCGWKTTRLYFRAGSEKEAEEIVKKLRNNPEKTAVRAGCADCFAEKTFSVGGAR